MRTKIAPIRLTAGEVAMVERVRSVVGASNLSEVMRMGLRLLADRYDPQHSERPPVGSRRARRVRGEAA